MNSMLSGATDVAKDSLNERPVAVAWRMHVKACLMHSIGDVRPCQC
jgi:hypothetical protein